MGKNSTTKHHRSLFSGGRFDLMISTELQVSTAPQHLPGDHVHTPCNDIENEDNETENATSGRTLPCGTLGGDRRGLNKKAQRELEKGSEDELEHGEGDGYRRIQKTGCLSWGYKKSVGGRERGCLYEAL